MHLTPKRIATFWARIAVGGPTECWPWQGGTNSKGYGWFKVNGVSTKAHRIAWRLHNGSIPEGAKILHECDNPPCCNPAHLFAGDNAENVRQRTQRNRTSVGLTHSMAVRFGMKKAGFNVRSI